MCSSLFGKKFPGYYVTLEGDTIDCVFEVRVYLFDRLNLKPVALRRKVKIIEDGVVKKFRPHEIKTFQIDLTIRGAEKYVPLLMQDRLWFVRLVEEGEINVYEYYSNDNPYGPASLYYVIEEDGKFAKLISI